MMSPTGDSTVESFNSHPELVTSGITPGTFVGILTNYETP